MNERIVIDRECMTAVCGGNDALAIELVAMLLDEATPIVAALHQHVQSYQVTLVNELAHSLKGIAGSVGAFELRDAAADLETASARQLTPPSTALIAGAAAISDALENVRKTL
jgi:HPt (histidine-containing phosphotransfer) domain-containing protein